MDEVAEVKNRLEITEVVGAYVPLKQAGRNLKAPCPFHAEKSASFMVSPDKGIYHCFGCGEGGDVFSFVMKMEGLEFREALEKLARQAGVELKARKGEDAELKKVRGRMYEAHELATKYFQASLVQNANALEYVVKKRGLKRQTIQDFQIGYAPDSWNALTDFLAKKEYRPQELIRSGLAGQKEGRSTIYDLFRGRIMFTICDREGRPIGFTGRVLDDSVPKYLNTPQTPLYDKSQAIFGLHLAKEAIRAKDEVVLVEGNMDVIASHQAGVKQVVAASGTALTMDQLRTLSKLTKNIKLAFDADRAGLAATERAIELGQKLGLTLRMVETGEAKDADELIAQDPELWVQAIARAKYIVDYLFDRFEQDFDLTSAIGKRQYTDRLAANLRRLGDPVERDHYTKLLAGKLGIDDDAVKAKIDQADTTGPPVAEPKRAVVQAQGKPTARTQLEETFLAVTLAHPLTRISLDDVKAEHFSSVARQRVYEQMQERKEESGEAIAVALGEYGDYAKALLMIAEHEFAGLPEPNLHFQAFSLAGKVLAKANDELKVELNRQIREADAAGDEATVEGLMRRLQAIVEQEV